MAHSLYLIIMQSNAAPCISFVCFTFLFMSLGPQARRPSNFASWIALLSIITTIVVFGQSCDQHHNVGTRVATIEFSIVACFALIPLYLLSIGQLPLIAKFPPVLWWLQYVLVFIGAGATALAVFSIVTPTLESVGFRLLFLSGMVWAVLVVVVRLKNQRHTNATRGSSSNLT